MRNLDELNINDGGRPIDRPPPSDSIVNEFERRYRLKLPPVYINLLRHANGGHPELDSIELENASGSRWSVNRFFHLTEDTAGPDSLWVAVEAWRPVLGNGALPIANDGGGNVFFIDDGSNSGAIRICIHDESFAIRDIAPSFEDFIDKLSIDPDLI